MGISSLLGAGISGAASIFGASQQASAAKKAAAIQAQTAQMALNQQKAQFDQTQNNLAPYMATGAQASGALGSRLGELTTAVPLPDQLTHQFTQAELEATPGYQFTLGQGLKATQNSAAARGLGVSGAALKGAANYATGLSDQTYNTRFQQNQTQGQNIFNANVTNQQNAYNRLYQTAGLGANAAAGLGQIGQSNANAQSQLLTNSGAAQAAGINGAAAAWNSGINGVGNALQSGIAGYNQNALLNSMLQNKGIAQPQGLFSGWGF